MKEQFRFILFCVILSIVYGIGHDMVTANVAVEYFTVYHKPVVDSNSPIVMALVWGVIATYWLGAFAGIILAAANSIGKWPSVPWSSLMRWAINGTVMQWLVAMIILANGIKNVAFIPAGMLTKMGGDQRLAAVLLTHNWSYASSVVLVVVLIYLTLANRAKLNKLPRPTPEP